MQKFQTNRTKYLFGLLLLGVAGYVAFHALTGVQPRNELKNQTAAVVKLAAPPTKMDFGKLPLRFEVNAGQVSNEVRFVSRGPGFALFLTGTEAVLSMQKNDRRKAPSVLRMRLDGANRTTEVAGVDQLAGASNYFIGDDPGEWKTNVPSFSCIRYRDVYPGIDQVFYGNGRQLEYDLIVAPGVDAAQVSLAFNGAEDLALAENGDLVIQIDGEEMRQQRPAVYQVIDGEQRAVAASYVIRHPRSPLEDRRVGFDLGAFDHSQPLVIDPVLVYSTYLGGNGADSGRSIAVDAAHNVYVTGSTLSTTFPTANPLQSANASPSFGDVFVTKINAAGDQILYSTYIGGNAGDIGHGIDVDHAGNVYVTGVSGGTSGANSFPTTQNAFDSSFNAPDESFLLKLNPTGDGLMYSTYTGASIGFEVKVDRTTGEAFVAGNAGANLPTTPGAFATSCQPAPCVSSAFVSKFNAAGTALVYSTYIGPGPANDLAIDAEGNAYITGSTISNVFPITAGAAQSICTGCNLQHSDAFVTKLNATGSALVYSTYLGGSIDEIGRNIAVDGSGNAYVTGKTESSSAVMVPFPTTPGAFQTTSLGIPDAFVTKLNPAGTAFVYSTYVGGNVSDEGYGIAVDPQGKAHITGRVRSRNFPLAAPLQTTCPANGDCVFITTLNPAGSGITFSTFFGQGQGLEIVTDDVGNAYVTGEAIQGVTTLPTMNPIQPNHAGGNSSLDAFVAKFGSQVLPRKTLFDFDGDGKADVSVFRASDTVWYLLGSSTGFSATQFGNATDRMAPADLDGDGKTDIAVFRDGAWYWLNSSDGSFHAIQFGLAGDIPVPADFTGDGRAELAVYRAGVWYTLDLAANQFQSVQFGLLSDRVVPADFDGDGKADRAVYRDGVWYWLSSSDGQFHGAQFGIASDRPVAADYDGDGTADLAVYRSGVWYVLGSTRGFFSASFGTIQDSPVAADYDGDGKTDLAVFHEGSWTWLSSSSGLTGSAQFGIAADRPIPAAFVP
jgi:hypothetical protein